MALSIRERVLAAAKTALAGITGIPGLTVDRDRRDPVEDFPAIVLQDGGQVVTARVVGAELVTQRADIELYSRAAASGTEINALHAAAKAALLADVTLGGLATDIREIETTPAEADIGDTDRPYRAAVLQMEIDFWTTEADPTVQGPA